jgi:oxygen-independent coproporphyrinogen-3 oxidase
MRDKAAAFSNATEALLQLDVPNVLPKLREADVFVRRFILGGSHSVVTYPPLNALQELGPRDTIHPIYYGDEASLYVHISFCETMCTFCHYDVKHYRGKSHSPPGRVQAVERYLSALKVEMKDWAYELQGSETVINSIYIGGGTPLVLEKDQLIDLLQTIRAEFNVREGAEICVEASPLTITAEGGLEKLQTLKQHGVTRLSFGIQSFDDEVLKRAARGYKRETAIRACELADLVFDNWNLDLIQSLYKGTPDEVWENLQVLRQVRPPHLTWYHGRYAKRPQGDWYRDIDKQVDFEGEHDTLIGRMLLWEELAAMGYRQIDGNRFVLDERYTDPFKKVRTSVSSNLLGLGASSYSHVDMRPHPRWFTVPEGVFFRNTSGANDYVTRIESGDGAVGSALALGWNEYLAASYVVSLRTGRLDSENHEWAHPEMVAHYAELERHFVELGLLERCQICSEPAIRLTRLGQLLEDEVLSLFYSRRVQELLREAD